MFVGELVNRAICHRGVSIGGMVIGLLVIGRMSRSPTKTSKARTRVKLINCWPPPPSLLRSLRSDSFEYSRCKLPTIFACHPFIKVLIFNITIMPNYYDHLFELC